MPLYICRWPNGDFSAVSAASKDEAIILLDEVDNAELGDLFTVKNFMVHFRLNQEVECLDELIPVELEGFGERTVGVLCDRVYPVYHRAAMDVHEDWPDDGTTEVPQEKMDSSSKRLNDALITERNRQWKAKEPALSTDVGAAELQRQRPDFPRALAEDIARQHRRRQIVEMPPASKKPQ